MPGRISLLFFALFVVMLGFAMTIPVLPSFVARLGIGPEISNASLAIHVGGLTSAYAATQLGAAPFWGRWSDRNGRKPLVVWGLSGFAVAQALFGLGASLTFLYAARLAGGVFSAALLVATSSYIADTTPPGSRGRMMALQGAAISLGFVAGPAMGGMLARSNWHFAAGTTHLAFDGFSVPFFAAAILALATLPAVLYFLPESRRTDADAVRDRSEPSAPWRAIGGQLGIFLVLLLGSQASLTLFEAVFALWGTRALGLGPGELGFVFAFCGAVMALGQVVLVRPSSGQSMPQRQVVIGFFLLGAGILMLPYASDLRLVLMAVTTLALGVALITPNLLALGADQSGDTTGAGMGLLNAAASAGQVIGPLAGGFLFAWNMPLAFRVAGAAALGMGAWSWWKLDDSSSGHAIEQSAV